MQLPTTICILTDKWPTAVTLACIRCLTLWVYAISAQHRVGNATGIGLQAVRCTHDLHRSLLQIPRCAAPR